MMNGSAAQDQAVYKLAQLIQQASTLEVANEIWEKLEGSLCCKVKGFTHGTVAFCDYCAIQKMPELKLERNSKHYLLPPWIREVPVCHECLTTPIGILSRGDRCTECILDAWQLLDNKKTTTSPVIDPELIALDQSSRSGSGSPGTSTHNEGTIQPETNKDDYDCPLECKCEDCPFLKLKTLSPTYFPKDTTEEMEGMPGEDSDSSEEILSVLLNENRVSPNGITQRPGHRSTKINNRPPTPWSVEELPPE